MKNLFISLKITVTFCAILFVGYVLVLWGFSAIFTPNSGRAEVAVLNGKVVGASNVAQAFTSTKYFWSRPSSVEYDGSSSGGSNYGPTNPDHLAEVEARIESFLEAHPYLDRSEVPAEIVTASGSGLDPHISPASAMVQVIRVAQARGADPKEIIDVLKSQTETPLVGVPTVNVLKLNIALDEKYNN